jgi:hypothetical protein
MNPASTCFVIGGGGTGYTALDAQEKQVIQASPISSAVTGILARSGKAECGNSFNMTLIIRQTVLQVKTISKLYLREMPAAASVIRNF